VPMYVTLSKRDNFDQAGV